MIEVRGVEESKARGRGPLSHGETRARTGYTSLFRRRSELRLQNKKSCKSSRFRQSATERHLSAVCGRSHCICATSRQPWPKRSPWQRVKGTDSSLANGRNVLQLSGLPRTSEKTRVPWRENRVALLLIRADGSVEQSHRLAEKRRLVDACGSADRLLAVWMQRFHPLVLSVDDLEPARVALADR